MPALARADLESLLRLKKLDHTVTAFERAQLETAWLVPTGAVHLDERLGGGFPRGHMSEVVGSRSSGRLSAALSTMAAATKRGARR